MIITLLTDNDSSWFVKYGEKLKQKLNDEGHTVLYVFNKKEIANGDICFLLSCTRLIEEEFLSYNKNNIVVHASDLPFGKGFSPLQWQIYEGKNEITLTLFEVVKEVDSGPFYKKDIVFYDGTELLDELREKMAQKIIEMCLNYVKNHNSIKPKKQVGDGSYYRRRKSNDDEINPRKSILELFNHFRIADNNNYPLFFFNKGEKYIIKIEKHKK